MRSMRKGITILGTLGLLLGHKLAFALPQMNMHPGVTPISRDVFDLHMAIIYICAAIGVVVFGVMFYAMYKFRKSQGAVAQPIHGNLKLEIIWTIIPVIILVAMAFPATKILLESADTEDYDLSIEVTGHQWYWQYKYPAQNIEFFSRLSTPEAQLKNLEPKGKWYLIEVDKPLVVPIHKKIRFLVTSSDVIHSWWVPALAVKRDAVPGYIHESWARIDKAGTYRGQCAELCGLNHGYMPIVVEAKTQEDYDKWVKSLSQTPEEKAKAAEEAANKVWTKEELMKQGESVYSSHCAVCHKPDGSGQPPAFPALAGSKVANGPVAGHINIVMHGVTGTAMQAFANQLSDADIAAIVTYERNAWGNGDTAKFGSDAGGLVQPKDIAGSRK